MLYSKDGKTLLYSLAAGMQNEEAVVLSKEVTKIEHDAFRNTLCEEIIFRNASIRVHGNSFKESRWLEKQGDYALIGSMFYRLCRSVPKLEIPDSVRRYHEDAFYRSCVQHLIVRTLPPVRQLEQMQLSSLTITGTSGKINFPHLQALKALSFIELTGHRMYESRDGVVFSKNGANLLYYPPRKSGTAYEIPDGTRKICRMAFHEQACLSLIRFPKSVRSIEPGAFYGCRNLQEVFLPEGVRELPDASVFQNHGVFACCKSLKTVHLPPGIRHIGSCAFQETALEEIRLPEGLRSIGEYAFSTTNLNNLALPASVRIVGKGAFQDTGTIEAQEGTARGLISALEAVAYGESEKPANLKWHAARIIMHSRRFQTPVQLMIPMNMRRRDAVYLEAAWNQERFDFEEYAECFPNISDSAERLAFAVTALPYLPGENNPYEEYLRHSSSKIATRLLENGDEQGFISFLQKGYLSSNAFDRLLQISNRQGLGTAAAYILQYRKKQKPKGRSKVLRL